MSALAEKRTQFGAPEEILTGLIALASSTDGIDIVVAAHEGFTYAVNARNPEYEILADELAALASAYLQAIRQRIPGGEVYARVAMGEYEGKAILVADVGEGFTFLAMGEYAGVKAIFDPVLRIVEGKPFKCPACGVVLDIYTGRCPGCGRLVPVTQPTCPFCGYTVSSRPCPNCGKMLSLSVSRVELARPGGEAEGEREEGVEEVAVVRVESPRVRAARRLLKAVIGSAVAGIYFVSTYILGVSPAAAIVAGLVPLATVFALLLSEPG